MATKKKFVHVFTWKGGGQAELRALRHKGHRIPFDQVAVGTQRIQVSYERSSDPEFRFRSHLVSLGGELKSLKWTCSVDGDAAVKIDSAETVAANWYGRGRRA